MEMRPLGTTKLKVSALVLGTAAFGASRHGCRMVDERSAADLLDMAWDAGINLLDTADVYGGGASEELLGRLLARRRNRFLLATKVGGRMGTADRGGGGLSARHIMNALEASLRRLRTDHVDLYMAHGPDAGTPIGETMEAFARARGAGQVRVVGCSNFSAAQLRAARSAGGRGRTGFEFNQIQFSLANPIAPGLAQACGEASVSLLAWGPLARGALSGKRRAGSDRRLEATSLPKHRLRPLLQTLRAVAASEETTLAQTALGWVLGKPWITAAVCAASVTAQLRELLGSRPLSSRSSAFLDRASALCTVARAPLPEAGS